MGKSVIIIPSRLEAKRLPNKPLLEINNIPIIIHVMNRAKESNIGEVFVATPDEEIFNLVKKNSGNSILTKNDHPTGTDRVFEAYQKIKDKEIDLVINLQGDMPNVEPTNILKLNELMKKTDGKIGTLASKISKQDELKDKNIVKVRTKKSLNIGNFLEAEDFFRIKNLKENRNIYHHLGIYAFKPSILEKFINLKRSKNEIERNLEQLRALDSGIKIDVALTSSLPLSVDTKEDLEKVRLLMNLKK